MSSNNTKKLAKNTLILNIRLIITLIISLYSSRLILKVLGIEDYGLYNLIGGFVALLSIITSSITGSISRFITYDLGKGDLEKLNDTFCTVMNVLFIFSMIVLIIASTFGFWFIDSYLNIPDSKINSSYIVYSCSVIVFILNLLSIPYTSLVIAHEKMNFYAIMAIYDSLMKLAILSLLLWWGENKVVLYSILLAFSSLINRIIYHIYCRTKYAESNYKFKVNKKTFKEVMSFSVWMGIGSISGILKDQGGNILINIFFGLTLNAAYGIANQVRSLLLQFGNNIGMAISPQITKSYAEGNASRSIELTLFMVKCNATFMLLIVIPMLCETSNILNLWLNIVPSYSVDFVRIIVFLTFISIINSSYGPIYLANGNIRNYQMIGSIILITYVPVTYLLLKIYSYETIPLIVASSYELFFLFANFICLKILINFPLIAFFKDVLLRIILAGALSFIVVWYSKDVFNIDGIIKFIIVCIESSILVCFSTFYFILNKKERNIAVNFIQEKIHYGRSNNI